MTTMLESGLPACNVGQCNPNDQQWGRVVMSSLDKVLRKIFRHLLRHDPLKEHI